jgi:nucleoside-diphosphate-sugar epimerase
MRIVIAGGHGKIARILARSLAAAGDNPVGVVRGPAQVDHLSELGAEPVVLDLESVEAVELARSVEGADAVVFAAGAGPGSGIPRKFSVDRDAAVLLADAAEIAGIRRYVLISSRGAVTVSSEVSPEWLGRRCREELDRAQAEHQSHVDPVFTAYLQAKSEADHIVANRSGLDVAIVRPGLLTDDPGTGLVELSPTTEPGYIARADVAAVVEALLRRTTPLTETVELIAGHTPVQDAVDQIAHVGPFEQS